MLDASVPSEEETVAIVGHALANLTYEERKGSNPMKRVSEIQYARGLIELYMGRYAPARTTGTDLCPMSLMIGRALMTATHIRFTRPENDNIVRGED